jgi:pimeloyl-ACP methyl ester carboxylesterase
LLQCNIICVVINQTTQKVIFVSDQTSEHPHPVSLLPPAIDAALEYTLDTWQRSVLYADVMRQRGNQYQRHMSKQAPNVLSMKAEVILDGRTLERPVNYILTRITPPKSIPIDPIKRPFVVVDPRAGHGPGIAGFKPESEIGVALEAGHPCYFIGFLPRPEPDQGVEDVVWAETRFLEEVISLHPEAEGKPVVIGNCQAGWQLMMAASTRPELFGPIIIAGAPLSYWAGWRNKNPMRYTGGMTGGSWMTTMSSDLGGGLFDGANLVQNFENLHPSNTYWSKQYNLYANVDTEASRYLGFERWWGGHVFLNGKEIQYIVDNLFVGNKLSTARLVTQDGLRIDLRNIRSPIIVFCSKGDNITPPPQALGWITDLYQNDKEVLAHGQTIIYAIHESIGHLGIFVSGAVAKKEHREFTCNIDLIDMLPPGIYEAVIRDKTPDTPNADLAYGDYVLTFERRHLADIEAIVQPREDDDRRFAAVSRISQVNQGLYKSFVQPWVKAFATPRSTERREQTHPLRMHYEAVSDKNPMIAALAPVAVQVRNKRRKAAADNPFVQLEKQISKSIESSLDLWGEWRDAMIERTFMAVYGSPLVQDIAGLGAREGSPREHPGVSPEHIAFVRRRVDELRKLVQCGGLREAGIRVMMYIAQAQGGIDARSFNLIRQLRAQQEHSLSLAAFKKLVREQAMVMVVDPEGAVAAIPSLLSHHGASEIEAALEFVTRVATASGALNTEGKKRLAQVAKFYHLATQQSSQTQQVDGLTAVNLRRPLDTNLANNTTSDAHEPALTKTVIEKTPAKKVAAKKAVGKKVVARSAATKKVTVKPTTSATAKRVKKAIV